MTDNTKMREAFERDHGPLCADKDMQKYFARHEAAMQWAWQAAQAVQAAELERLRKDAERYRWLRVNWFTMASEYGNNGTVKFQINQPRYSSATEATLDATIDAAIAGEKK